MRHFEVTKSFSCIVLYKDIASPWWVKAHIKFKKKHLQRWPFCGLGSNCSSACCTLSFELSTASVLPYKIIKSPTQVINSTTLGGCLNCWQMAVSGLVRRGGRIYARLETLLENESNDQGFPSPMKPISSKMDWQLHTHMASVGHFNCNSLIKEPQLNKKTSLFWKNWFS